MALAGRGCVTVVGRSRQEVVVVATLRPSKPVRVAETLQKNHRAHDIACERACRHLSRRLGGRNLPIRGRLPGTVRRRPIFITTRSWSFFKVPHIAGDGSVHRWRLTSALSDSSSVEAHVQGTAGANLVKCATGRRSTTNTRRRAHHNEASGVAHYASKTIVFALQIRSFF